LIINKYDEEMQQGKRKISKTEEISYSCKLWK